MVLKGAQTLARAEVPQLHGAIGTARREQIALQRVPREAQNSIRVRIRLQELLGELLASLTSLFATMMDQVQLWKVYVAA